MQVLFLFVLKNKFFNHIIKKVPLRYNSYTELEIKLSNFLRRKYKGDFFRFIELRLSSLQVLIFRNRLNKKKN